MLVEFAEYDQKTHKWTRIQEFHASHKAADIRARAKKWVILCYDKRSTK